jgi:hypothetical protein
LFRPAEIGTLDQVINVHPGWERLAGLAAARHPRSEAHHCRHKSDAPSTEKPVRALFRSGDAIERIAGENGLTPHVASDVGPAWKLAGFSPRMNQPREVTKLSRGS